MVGATRSSYQKSNVKSAPSSQGDNDPSSGTIVVDEGMNLPNGRQDYATPQRTECSNRSDIYRLSQEKEPLPVRNGNGSRLPSVGIATNEADPLGEHVKEAIATISKLEGLGLQRLNIPLPKCVVLGEQSTGKSSVIEAISGIKTPRATETCTRCPLFINMESVDDPRAPWSARVVLRQQYKWDGKGRERRFPEWVPLQTPVDIDFAETNSRDELERIIGRAQLAILSPFEEPDRFMEVSIPEPITWHLCKFSPNIVCIYVTQPNLPSLSFYDLPGIIGQAESTSDDHLVPFVRNLVTEYIKDPETLILVTCSLADDIANSSATGIARSLSATERCIGVLTKPDCLPPGSREDKLRDVLDGQRFALGHGYFVVKNLNQEDLDRRLTHREARLQEVEFFNTSAPWATYLGNYQDRFGTPNLQTYLSKKLAAQIVKTLPTINEQIDARLHKVDQDLKQIPTPPTHNACRIISDILLEFSTHVRQEMEAEFPKRDWHNCWQSLQKAFMNGLISMKPTMATSGSLDEGIYSCMTPGKSVDDSILIDSGDEEDTNMLEINTTDTPTTPVSAKKRKLDRDGTPTPCRTPVKSGGSRAAGLSLKHNDSPTSDFAHLRKVFKLDDVARHLCETSKSKIPDQIEPKVIDELILGTLEHWDLAMQKFFKTLETELKAHVHKIFNSYFKQWQGSELYRAAWAIVESFLGNNFNEQRDTMAAESLNDEREGPYIFHGDIFNREKVAILESYRQHRFRVRTKIYEKEMLAITGRAMTQSDLDKLQKDEKKRAILLEEPYEKEIKVVAQITTYYMIAARRFHDSICMRVQSKFFKMLRTNLRDDLDSGLGIHDEHGTQNAIRLLAEPPHRQQRRQELVAMKTALLKGQKCLNELHMKYHDGPSSSQTSDSGMNFSSSSFGPTSTPLTEEMEDISRSSRLRR